jgi:hypothetical protein
MPGRFINSPAHLVGQKYLNVAEYPYSPPIAVSGDRCVYKGYQKVLLVKDGVVMDFYDWDVYGNDYRNAQKMAQDVWGITWHIT